MSANGKGQVRVVVLGAAGTIAPAILEDLAASDEVVNVLALDLDGERAAAAATAHGGEKATARAADARAGLAEQLQGHDVLINAASYNVNLDAMEACLAAGCDYIDLGGLYHVTMEQLELGDRFKKAGRLALLGMGSSPGKTNLMAARAVAELGDVDSIDIIAGGRDFNPPGSFSPPYAVQTLIDEVTLKPVVLRDGKPTEIEPLTSGGTIDFGEPIGSAETIYTLHSELVSFGESFNCAECSFRLSLSPAVEERLRELAQGSPQDIARAQREAAPPSAETVSIHVIEARGSGRMMRVRSVTSPHRPFALGGSVVSTAAPAVAAVRLLARGRIDAIGAQFPERCIDPEDLFAEVATRSCEISVRVEELAA
ncbi:MAG TPA: saccharopine dehydrogenase NADP-binding domain-containing protein [Solirubrobacteraceae bacterium]|nr:saccharopine dehydrogenase NADP-binding domain-containing protein [Solirubrobacteraceae bacterium]